MTIMTVKSLLTPVVQDYQMCVALVFKNLIDLGG